MAAVARAPWQTRRPPPPPSSRVRRSSGTMRASRTISLRLMSRVVAMRLFATPSPAISNAVARVTTRYGALPLCAPSGASNVNIFPRHTTS